MNYKSSDITGLYDPFKLVRITRPLNFTVHFRQPKDMAGRYGFDYPRDADRYPMERVFKDVDGTVINDRKMLYKKNISGFNNIYLQGAKVSGQLQNYDYLPAWLMMFPHTSNRVNKGGSIMHSKGIALDIEIQQLIGDTSSLSATKFTELRFVIDDTASSKLTLSRKSIKLSEFISEGVKQTTVVA